MYFQPALQHELYLESKDPDPPGSSQSSLSQIEVDWNQWCQSFDRDFVQEELVSLYLARNHKDLAQTDRKVVPKSP
jgi:hypothetical protein